MRYSSCNDLIDKECHRLPEIQNQVVLGLSITDQWKRALALESTKLTESAKGILINKSIHSKELDITWTLLDQMYIDKQIPLSSITNTFINYCERNVKHQIVLDEHLPRMLGYFEKFQKLFNERQANRIIDLVKRAGKEAQLTTMDFR